MQKAVQPTSRSRPPTAQNVSVRLGTSETTRAWVAPLSCVTPPVSIQGAPMLPFSNGSFQIQNAKGHRLGLGFGSPWREGYRGAVVPINGGKQSYKPAPLVQTSREGGF